MHAIVSYFKQKISSRRLYRETRQLIEANRRRSLRTLKALLLERIGAYGLDATNPEHRTLIKRLLLDLLVGDRRLRFTNLHRTLIQYKTIDQLLAMVLRKYGHGTIGFKAIGMETAFAVLSKAQIRRKYGITLPVKKPQSFYLGSNLLLEFLHYHEQTLGRYRKLKYEPYETIVAVQEELETAFMAATLPPSILNSLREILKEIRRPIIVRSSSKLEDNPDASFAGKYDSYFLANEGSDSERLEALVRALKKTWLSVFKPDAIVYRRKIGFLRRDEQMGVLIQKVIGRKFDVEYPDPRTGRWQRRRLFAPILAGVGFSRNLIYILSPRMKQEDGLVRLVVGLGTRAVERNRAYEASLSLPGFFPEQNPYRMQKMTQSTMDCLDLERNEIVHVPIAWAARYSPKFYDLVSPFLSVIKDNYLRPLSSQFEIEFEGTPEQRISDNVITDFHTLLQTQTRYKGFNFPAEFRAILRALEEAFAHPVDIEFAINVDEHGEMYFYILQARAQLYSEALQQVKIPRYQRRDLIIENCQCLTNGKSRQGSEYLLYVDSRAYKDFPDKQAIARAIGRIVHHPRLCEKGIIAILPGRTGSKNPELGVPVRFSEISEILGLVEYGDDVLTTDISYGTHFYSEIRDINIPFMPVQKHHPATFFNEDFLKNAPSVTRELLPSAGVEKVVRVIHISAAFPTKKVFMYLNGMEKHGVLLLRKT